MRPSLSSQPSPEVADPAHTPQGYNAPCLPHRRSHDFYFVKIITEVSTPGHHVRYPEEDETVATLKPLVYDRLSIYF